MAVDRYFEILYLCPTLHSPPKKKTFLCLLTFPLVIQGHSQLPTKNQNCNKSRGNLFFDNDSLKMF